MSYATLMVYVDTGHMPEERLRLAARLASQFNAALIELSAIAIRPRVAAEGVVIAETTAASGFEAPPFREVDNVDADRRVCQDVYRNGLCSAALDYVLAVLPSTPNHSHAGRH